MDQDGVDAELLFPAVSGPRTLDVAAIPPEAYVALAQGYNYWLSQEYTAEDRDRLLGLAILPDATIDDSVAELQRVASMPGIRGIVLHHWPNGSPVPVPDEDDRFGSGRSSSVCRSRPMSASEGERLPKRTPSPSRQIAACR
jgi:hypothetical protein